MISLTPPRRSPRRSHSRPLGLALCLMALSVTGGCAHFREGAERARGRDDGGSSTAAPLPPPAPRPAPVEPTPAPAPQPAPVPVAPPPPPATPVSPAPVTSAEPDNSKAEAASRKAAAAASRAAEADSRKAQAAADKAQRVQDKAARRAEKEPPPAPAPVREPIAVAGPTVDRVPVPVPQPAPAPVPAPVPVAPPASDEPASPNAIVTFASTAGTQCGACETLKISVTPGGKVLIESGRFNGNGSDWRYRRSSAHVAPERAAAFAARLAAWRPHGRQAPTCAAPAGRDSGVVVEWFEMGRNDQLNVKFACVDAQTSEMLRSAPALLGLRQLDFPWAASH